eukprot:scaffold28998_cov42-Prasinocladus_malaysianus.AAC.1
MSSAVVTHLLNYFSMRMQPAFMNLGTSVEHKKVAQLVGQLVGAEATGGRLMTRSKPSLMLTNAELVRKSDKS